MHTVAAEIVIAAPPAAVWTALVDPVLGEAWRGARFETEWQPQSPIRITAPIRPPG